MKKIYLCFSFFVMMEMPAQPVLKPSIGLTSLPGDNTAICNIPCSPNYNFSTDGLQVGDTIPQFMFYTVAGVPYDAQSFLNTGKPLCIISGSFTCPVFRGKIADINTLVSTYGTQVNFVVVYVVEPHPKSPDISPYSCNVWNPTQNQTDGVMYLQPTTYGIKKATATDMLNNTCSCIPSINCPVIIDGPCNNFWSTFGPAPNNAYLVDPTNGTVNCKHDWFNKAPNDMRTCISSLLSTLSTQQVNGTAFSHVFPNPFNESATIKFTNGGIHNEKVQLKITDLNGREVKAEISKSVEGFVIRKNDLEAGIYFYHVMDGKNILSKGKLNVN